METKKTAIEWFQHLPEPYRSQAVENFKADTDYTDEDLFKSLSDSLINGFFWVETPQGFRYWSEIKARAIDGEFDKPFPELHGWIPVSERLPTADDADEFGNVLIYHSDTNEPEKNMSKGIIKWNMLRHSDPNTTFWQPLPKLPEVQ